MVLTGAEGRDELGGLTQVYARPAPSVTVPSTMAARKATRDVSERVRDPGFTPSVRDVPALVALLGDADEDVARDAEKALVRLGSPLVPLAPGAASHAGEKARARLVRAVGTIAARDEGDAAVAWLVDELATGEGRGARYAATALGKMRGHAREAETALLAAWERTPSIELRRAIADALGKVGTSEAAKALAAPPSSDPELARRMGRARLRVDRVAVRAEPSAIDGDAVARGPCAVVFRCRAGLESILAGELGDEWSPRADGEGRVRAVLRGPLVKASVPRVAMSFALPLAEHPGTGPDAIAAAIASDESFRILRAFTRGPIRFRLAFEDGGHHRALVWKIAAAVAALRPEIVNDPTESPWTALVREHDGRVAVELEPRALPDTRFDYRIADVPAASHPTIAAALARVGGAREDDVVWDPFVGSALELIERARLGPYAALHGTDVDEHALESARANLARANVTDATLTLRDSTIFAPEGVTLALTNPPMGRRVARGELAPLVDRFIHNVARALAPGGRLVWLSPMPERSRARLTDAGLTIDLARPVDMGGFRAELQRATKA
jgi:23S rRNA G2445 N2-methylase RlmL